ncbi:MAG TPA: phosphate ABC transporter ATP-binding protein PstB [Gemmatimonadaceae bacterium]|jgi:phosphate transport system ATP-binding protein|nr:phosphate ABC transporter ATP-binding protein PstB [Gemmatimonadaceae bacterium]
MPPIEEETMTMPVPEPIRETSHRPPPPRVTINADVVRTQPAASSSPDQSEASGLVASATVVPKNGNAVPTLAAKGLHAYFGSHPAVRDVSVDFRDREVTAIIGPSGCGKSTLLRCLNRMHETLPATRVEGAVLFRGTDIYAREVNPIALRRHVGMVFQRPTPFPTMSIRDNVAAGLRVRDGGEPPRAQTDAIVERALRRTALWDEVKDRLKQSAVTLSGGQQQRLCVARALATEPAVLLLDEPTASLDPLSTQKIEELVYELRSEVTLIIVTHNMQQAARVSDRTAFLLAGELVEISPTSELFTAPSDPRTEAYITGRFG